MLGCVPYWDSAGAACRAASTDSVLAVDEVPYDLLFPQKMAAVVHHGGAGTTASAAAAGRPQVICPFVADQPFWGRLMQRRGVATTPIHQRHLTPDRLTTAISEAVTNSQHSPRPRHISAPLSAPNKEREPP